jgi:hypothetical protein
VTGPDQERRRREAELRRRNRLEEREQIVDGRGPLSDASGETAR